MFDVLLEKYINAMRSRLPAITYVQLSILVVGIILTAIASFVTSIKMSIIGGVILIIPLVWILIKGMVDQKKISTRKIKERFEERNVKFNKFLEENGLDNEKGKKWLRERCCERISEKPEKTEYLMPFVSVVMAPILLIIINLILDTDNWGENMKYVFLIVVLTFFVYLSIKLLESNIASIADKKYYYMKRLRDDLDMNEFYSEGKEIRNIILDTD